MRGAGGGIGELPSRSWSTSQVAAPRTSTTAAASRASIRRRRRATGSVALGGLQPSVERARHLARVAEPELAALGHGAHHDAVQGRVDALVPRPRLGRVARQDLVEQLDHAGAREGHVPRQALVQRDAQRVDVRAPVDLVGARLDLLGGGVLRRAPELSEGREGARFLGEGQPEIEQQRAAVRRDAHVRRLHVAVDDAGGVRALERPRDVPRVTDRRGDVHGLAAPARRPQQLVEPGTLDHLHREEGDALVLARVVHADDVLVPQAGDPHRLALEALARDGWRPRAPDG
jgi:hypothetical protein